MPALAAARFSGRASICQLLIISACASHRISISLPKAAILLAFLTSSTTLQEQEQQQTQTKTCERDPSQRRKDQGRKTKPRCLSCRGEILMVGSGPSNVFGLGSGPRKQPGLGGNEILRSFLSTRRSWCWRGRGKQTVRMTSTKSGFAVRVAGVGGSTCEAGDLDLVHARVQVPGAARALLRRARHAVVEAVDRTNNRDPRQLRSTERERERREGEGENERSVMDSSKPENERFSDSAFADSLRAWPHVSPA